jgi:hypothetical protein
MFFDITSQSGTPSAWIKLLPMLPYPGFIKNSATTSSLSVNGNTLVDTSATSTASDQQGWFLLPRFADYGSVSTAANAVSVNPYGANKGRCIGFGFRILFTGSASYAAGLVTTSESAFEIEDLGTNPNSITNCINSSVTQFYAPLAVKQGAINATFNATTYGATTRSHRPETGVAGTLPHTTQSYTFKPIYQTPVQLVSDKFSATVGTADPAYNCQFGGEAGANLGGVTWFDQDWDGCDIVLPFTNGSIAYRVEVIMCMEYQVSPSSAFSTLSRLPPPADESLLLKLQRAEANKDTSYGLTDFAQFASSAASVAATAYGIFMQRRATAV